MNAPNSKPFEAEVVNKYFLFAFIFGS